MLGTADKELISKSIKTKGSTIASALWLLRQALGTHADFSVSELSFGKSVYIVWSTSAERQGTFTFDSASVLALALPRLATEHKGGCNKFVHNQELIAASHPAYKAKAFTAITPEPSKEYAKDVAEVSSQLQTITITKDDLKNLLIGSINGISVYFKRVEPQSELSAGEDMDEFDSLMPKHQLRFYVKKNLHRHRRLYLYFLYYLLYQPGFPRRKLFFKNIRYDSHKRIAAAIIHPEGRVVAVGVNRSGEGGCFHAEVNALRHAWHRQLQGDLPYDIYTTLEPCDMCAAFIARYLPKSSFFYAQADTGVSHMKRDVNPGGGRHQLGAGEEKSLRARLYTSRKHGIFEPKNYMPRTVNEKIIGAHTVDSLSDEKLQRMRKLQNIPQSPNKHVSITEFLKSNHLTEIIEAVIVAIDRKINKYEIITSLLDRGFDVNRERTDMIGLLYHLFGDVLNETGIGGFVEKSQR